MVVVARPDLLGALIARLRAITELTALVATSAGATDGRTTPRISGQRQDWWRMDPPPVGPAHSILLQRTGGPPGDYLGGLWFSRIDMTTYGPNNREATRLMDILLPTLCPAQGGTSGSFIQSGVRVYDIAPEAEMLVTSDPERAWPFAWLPVVVTWNGTPAP